MWAPGKTTLCRELISRFAEEPDIETHLILDPSFPTSSEFLGILCEMMTGKRPDTSQSETALKETLKQHLFEKGVQQQRTVVLIIDEGQKISAACAEILRELLNYETNTFKLLQIVLFAQKEFESILEQHANFADRINLLHYLAPMSFSDTRSMIRHRLKTFQQHAQTGKAWFTGPALWAIYTASKGYPRRIIHVCHQSMLAMIIQNKTRAGWAIIRSCKNRIRPSKPSFKKKMAWTGFLILAAAIALFAANPDWLAKAPDTVEQTVFKIDTAKHTPSVRLPATPLPEPASANPVAMAADVQPDAEKVPSEEKTPEPGTAEPIPKSHRTVDAAPAAPISPVPVLQEDQTDPVHAPTLPHLEPPALLGSLTVMPGDTIGRLIATVYGTYRNRYLKTLLEANPHILNPNSIEPGDEIHFPTMAFHTRIPSINANWIVFDTLTSLPESRERLDELHARTGIALRLISGWSAENGLRFQIAAKGYFASPESAGRYLSALPQQPAPEGSVISGWGDGTLLYADPFAGGRQ